MVKSHHARKCRCLLIKSNTENGLQNNPNNVAWILSSQNFRKEVYDVLLYGLNHGIATNPSSNDILPPMEFVLDKLNRNNLLKENYHSINRAKNCLQVLTFNLIELDNR